MATQATAVLQPASVTIRRGLHRLRRRIRLLLALRLGALAVTASAATMAALVIYLKLLGRWYPLTTIEYVLGGCLVPVTLVALLWPLPDRRVASSADRRLGLRDRLGTAIQLLVSRDHSGMQQAAILDAARFAQGLRAARAYPMKPRRSFKAAAGALCALAIAQFAPIPALLVSPQEREAKAELRKHAEHLKPIVQRLERGASEQHDEEAAKLAKRLRNLGRKFEHGSLSKKQALLTMKDLQKEIDKYAADKSREATKAAEKTAEQLRTQARKHLAAQAKRLAEKAASVGDSSAEKALKELERKIQKGSDARSLAQLASKLKAAGKGLGEAQPISAELAAALAEALESEKLQELLAKLGELQQDTDESLRQLSDEELRQLIEDLKKLSDALGGSDFETLSEALAEACECMNAGDLKGAREALARALGQCPGCRLAKYAHEGGG